MLKWWKMFSKNHKGFSLVELICTVAILSIVITSAGSAMVISARSYQRSNSELDLQQQAQITANLLTNLIIDANKIEIFNGDVLGDSGKTLKIVKDEPAVTYEITLVKPSEEEPGELKYTENGSEAKTLAEHIDDFSIKRISKNNYDFSLTIKSTDGRTFSSDYHVTPRNSDSAGSLSEAAGVRAAAIYAETKLVLEPNEIYYLNVNVTNAAAYDDGWPFKVEGIADNTDGGTSAVPYSDPGTPEYAGKNTIKIVVGRNERGGSFNNSFYITLAAKNAEGTEVTLRVEVLVRRVTAISVQGQKLDGSAAKAGAVYNVTAQTTASNPDKQLGAWYDINYKPTYPVTWEVRGEGLSGSWSEYVDVVASNGDINNPFYKLKLKRDIPMGGAIKIVAVAKHPAGTDGAGNNTNKTGLPYDVIQGEYVIKNASSINRGSSGDADYTAFSFNIGDLGHVVDVLTDTYFNKLQSNWSTATNASYNELKGIWDSKSDSERKDTVVRDYFNGKAKSYVEFRYVIDEEKSDESKWSPWIPLSEYNGGTPYFRPSEAVYFRPDKDYVLQTKVSFVNVDNTSIVYWPLEDTEQDLYMAEYFVSKVSISNIWFEWVWEVWWPDHERYEYNTKGMDTIPNIPKGPNQMFRLNIAEVTGYSQNGAHSCTYLKVEKEVSEGVWEEVTDSLESKWRESGGKDSVVIFFNNLRINTPGKYRILPYMKDISYKPSVNAETEKISFDLYDESTGEGIIYFNIVD